MSSHSHINSELLAQLLHQVKKTGDLAPLSQVPHLQKLDVSWISDSFG
jgi:hypothetical protein